MVHSNIIIIIIIIIIINPDENYTDCLLHTCVDWVSASHYCTSGRRTYGWHVIIVKDDAFVCKFVNVWCGNLVWAMETNIIPTLEI